MKVRYCIILVMCLLCLGFAWAQESPIDTIPSNIPVDSARTLTNPQSQSVKIDDALDEVVDYGSADTSWLDMERKEMHLVGEAYAKFQGRELLADYIIVKLDSNLAIAQGLRDPISGNMTGLPVFKEGTREIKSDFIRFNFESEKGIIKEFRTLEQDIYILGERTKYVSAKPGSEEDDAIYFKNGEFTTCDHDEPHYALKANKIKTVFNKVAVLGPTNVQISRVPTPLWLPFAFFPLKKQKSSGLIFPRDYEYSEQLGFGLNNVGYYLPINERVDVTLVGDIYFNGTFAIRPIVRYNKRYKYSGNVNLSFRRQVGEFIQEDELLSNRIRSFSIFWNHNQDPKAHPTRSFGGTLNFQTNNDNRRTFNDARTVSQNSLNSNINFNQRFPGKPYSLSASLTHSQNNTTRLVSVSLPNVDFRLSRIFPFERKTRVGEKKWYEDISLQYNANTTARIEAVDSVLFEPETIDDLRYGIRHGVDIQTNVKLLKYFTLTPSINYDEVYSSHTRRFGFDDQLIIETSEDTLSDGQIIINRDTTFGTRDTSIEEGLTPFRDFSMGVSLNTQIFSTLQFQKGWLRGIRYTIRPTISLSYDPDQTREEQDYIRRVRTSADPDRDELREYNKFGGLRNIYGVNPSGESLQLRYDFSGVVVGRAFAKKDSSFKKLDLLRTLSFGGNYDFAADSLNFSPISLRANTQLFRGVTTLRFNAGWSFYATNEEGRIIDKFYREETGDLLRFTGASLEIRNSIGADALRKLFGNRESGPDKKSTSPTGGFNATGAATDLIGLLENVQLEHNITFGFEVGVDTSFTEITRNVINLRISRLQLTPNWNLRVGNIGYNFIREEFTYPDFGLYRNLHCWEAGIDVQPQRGTYSFFIRVKPSSFSFLNVPYRRNNVDGPLDF